MILITLYVIRLFIAPQLWIDSLKGLRIDLFFWPIWLAYVIARGRLLRLFHWRAQDWLFLAFVIWCALTVVAAGSPPSQRALTSILNLTNWLVLFRLTVVSAGGAIGARRTAGVLVFFALVLAVEGISHYRSSSGLGWAGQTLGWVGEEAGKVGLDKRTRWINIFDGPGVFCVVYTIALPFVLRYLSPPHGWISRIAAIGPLGILLLAIYYTGSRGGWITTLVLFGAWWAARTGLSTPKLGALGAVAGALVLVGPSYLTSTRDPENFAQNRVEMWAEGIEMVQQNPLLGIGRGRFSEYTGSLLAHNSAVEVMGETGIVGLFLWAGIIYMGCKNLVYAIRESEDARERSDSRSLLHCIGGYLTSAMFVTLEYETLYFLLALAAATGDDLENPPRFEARDAAIILSIMFTFMLLLKVFVMGYGR